MNKKLQAARRELERLEWERERTTGEATAAELDRRIRDARWAVEDLELVERQAAVIGARRTARVLDGGLAADALLVMTFSLGNIHRFALGHGVQDPIAYTLAPMVDVALVVALSADAFLSRHTVKGDESSVWGTVLRWFAGVGTLVLNVWAAVAAMDTAGIVLHSVPPLLLLVLAEAAPHYRRGAVAVVAATEQAARNARTERVGTGTAQHGAEPVTAPREEPPALPAGESNPAAGTDTAETAAAPAPGGGKPSEAVPGTAVAVARSTSARSATGATKRVPQLPGTGRIARPAKSDAEVLAELAVMRTGAAAPLAVRTVCQEIGIGQPRLERLLEREGLSLEPLLPTRPEPQPRPALRPVPDLDLEPGDEHQEQQLQEA